MAYLENDSLRSLYKEMLRLSKSKLTKLCKEHSVSHLGSKKEMTDRILQKQEESKRKRVHSKHTQSHSRSRVHPKKVKRKRRVRKKKVEGRIRKKRVRSTQEEQVLKHFEYQPLVLRNALYTKGYSKKTQIMPTLQGEVFIATKTALHRDYLLISGYIGEITRARGNILTVICDICYLYLNEEVVIKCANKSLHYKCGAQEEKENIIFESQLLRYMHRLCDIDSPAHASLIKYYDFFEDERNYYLVMEKGEESLFEFTIQCHEWITLYTTI
eukprot:1068637_1